MKMINIAIVIPAYNEEKIMAKTLKVVGDYLAGHGCDYEIIVVDDGSTDATRQIVKQHNNPVIHLITNKINKGKGYSVKKGILNAQKDWILFIDADLSTPIGELQTFFNYQDDDVIIGSRALADSKLVVAQPLYRRWGGKIFNFLVRFLLMKDFKDTQCGFKLFKKAAAQKIFNLQTIDGFGFDIEILYIAKKHGFKIKELPVSWFNDKNTKVDFMRDSMRMLADIFRIRLNDKKGLYR